MKSESIHLISRSPEDTTRLGLILGKLLAPSDVVCLAGDLGAGKTALTRGIAEGLGCQSAVASPTFTLLMEHPASPSGITLYHFDVYRLADAEAFLTLGLDEYFDRGGVCVIEWGDRIADILPPSTLTILIRLTGPDTPQQRLFSLTWPGHAVELQQLERSFAGC
jgi:tRNA threonylcarbamoyladenosine biosynthesis protein TsaE